MPYSWHLPGSVGVPLAKVELVSLAAHCGICSVIGLLSSDGGGLSTSLVMSSSPSATKRKRFKGKDCMCTV